MNWENKLSMDACALRQKTSDNEEILSYNTVNFYDGCDSTKKTELISKYPNLRYREGFGVANACVIDSDSAVRMVQPTHGPERRQLFSRNFQAVPSFGKGCLDVTVTESLLKNGEAVHKCGRFSERDFDRFVPLTPCMQTWVKAQGENHIPIGANTREIWRCAAKNNVQVE